MACDMPEPCRFPSLNSGQKKFLWTHKEVDLALHAVVVFQVGDMEKFPHALSFKSLDPFFQSQHCPCFTAVEEEGDDKRLDCKADVVVPPHPV